jgi:phosphoserine phosphatase
MTQFYLLRHGTTEWNKDQRFRGRKDIPLSEYGLKEAEAVADVLENEGIDYVCASPLRRSVQTLTPLAKRFGKNVELQESVIDMNFGDWEGVSVEDAEKQYPEMFNTWKHNPEDVTFPGGESLAKVQDRAMSGILELAKKYPDKKVAVCSHRVVTKLVLLGLLGLGPEKFWVFFQNSACINRFSFNPPNAIINGVNETYHLDLLGPQMKTDF